MKNIELLNLEKYSVSSNYLMVEEGVYRDLNDTDITNCRIALSFELENGETVQYPLEDILDKYYLYVSTFLKRTERLSDNSPNLLRVELAGELDDIRNAKFIIGKRVYNEYAIKDDKKTYAKLVIE